MDSTTILSPDDGDAPVPALDDAAIAVDEPEAPQVLLVRVGDARLALPLDDVRAVTRPVRAVRLPGAPAWVAGLASARGGLVPVADLARLAGAEPIGAQGWRVLVERDGQAAFLAVHAVDGVHTLAADDPAAPPADPPPSSTLPRCGVVRLQTQGGADLGDATAADVLDVTAVFRELFEED